MACWVVKVGSALVTNEGRGLDRQAIEAWVDQIAQLHQMGHDVVLVSSGAIAEGLVRLGFETRPESLSELQACAAVGQMGLVQAYETLFHAQGIKTAQVLLTHQNLEDREQYLNARQTLRALLKHKVVPIINENDTVVTSEIKVGDNDTLGALVANLIEADILVILTDQRGLYSADPRKNPNAQFIAFGQAGDAALEKMAGGAASSLSKGGMITKILAAKRAARSGADTIIASGREPQCLVRLANDEAIGTRLVASKTKLQARKQWLADHLRARGSVVVDQGAAKRLVAGDVSLLPVGVIRVEGDFVRGEMVSVQNEAGEVLAHGLINYGASDARRLCGAHTHDIAQRLGFCEAPEMIHHDNMFVLAR